MSSNDLETAIISWPAMLIFDGDDELVYIENQAAWDADSDHHLATSFQPNDRLVDSTGRVFTLQSKLGKPTPIKLTPNALELNEVIDLIKRHQSQLGACCAAKLYFPTIYDAILSLRVNP